MRSPSTMRIIEIDITNACDKTCSNCTRLCGHYVRPYFMDFDTFKRAVDSLDGYEGIRSMMGGEPTLHPQFEQFVRYLGAKFPPKSDNPMIYPQREFFQGVQRVELQNSRLIDDNPSRIAVVGGGMFSNMGKSYRRHYEIINDILPHQGLNDHMNPIYHQSALITRKELGIPDDEWIRVRDKCWIQNEWSAGITPKGAFFCEVAGVLDMLLGGNGGWKLEPGWWKREPDDFGEQLQWCELCGFALDTFTRDSAEEIDDISPEWLERLKNVRSPKLAKGKVNVLDIKNGKISEKSKRENKHFTSAMPYAEHLEDKFNSANSVLFVDNFCEFSICKNFGNELNRALATAKDWLILCRTGKTVSADIMANLKRHVLNPGTLHVSEDFAVFSKNALSLREIGFDGIAHMDSVNDLIDKWQKSKVIPLSFDIPVYKSIFNIPEKSRVAVWGTGVAGANAVDQIKLANAEYVFAIDADVARIGTYFYGQTILPPKCLTDKRDDFDYIVAANYTRFDEIANRIVEYGIEESRILIMVGNQA